VKLYVDYSKKIIFTLLINIQMIIFIVSPAYADTIKYYCNGTWNEYVEEEPIKLEIDGENVVSDVMPLIIDDRSLIPIRLVSEKLNAKINWNEENGAAEVLYEDTKIVFKIDENVVNVNGEEILMDIPSVIVDNRMMIPTRFVCETLGMLVKWDVEERKIIINSEDDNKNTAINDIKYTINDNNLHIGIISNSEIKKYSTFRLDNHPRIVIDIYDTMLKASKQELELENENIYCIRKSQFQEEPYVTRIVIDMKDSYSYDTSISKDKKEVYLDIAFNNEIELEDERDELGIAQGIVEYAKQYIGVEYVWAGESPEGFDCSGFVKYVYDEFGITLPHNAEQQSQYGEIVEYEDLQPSDVMFFDTDGGKDYINHVGIYLGNDLFIHASSSTKNGSEVVISEMPGFYKDCYICARRYTN
jgi:hypothetical protein